MRKRIYCLVLGLTMMVTSGASIADKVYLGLSVGASETDTGVTGLTGTASLDEEDTSFKLLVGKSVSDNVSIEGFYIDYGESSLTGNAGDQFVIDGVVLQFLVNNGKISAEATAIGANALVSYKASDDLALYGKFGLVRWDSEFSISGTGIGSASISETGTDPFFGVGVRYDLSTQFSLDFGFEMYEVDEDDIDVLSVSLIYNLM